MQVSQEAAELARQKQKKARLTGSEHFDSVWFDFSLITL